MTPQTLGQIFDNNSNCYVRLAIPAMTKARFVEVVIPLLEERDKEIERLNGLIEKAARTAVKLTNSYHQKHRDDFSKFIMGELPKSGIFEFPADESIVDETLKNIL